MRDMLLLINLDSPTSRAVAKKLRGEGFFCLITTPGQPIAEALTPETKGLVICGGAEGVTAEIPELEAVLATGLPILAFGDAALGLCAARGGSVVSLGGSASSLNISGGSGEPLLEGIREAERYLTVPMGMNLPSGMRPVSWTSEGAVMGFAFVDRPVYGFAFHVENNDPEGVRLLQNFAGPVCGCEPWWSESVFIDAAVAEIREAADGGEAICAISGGVDSAVCAALGTQALGEKMHSLFIDTGLLREGEADSVMENLSRVAGLHVTRIDAREEFLAALEGVRSPKEKQQIIYSRLRAHIRHEVSGMPDVRLILQGTNYSDIYGSSLTMRPELSGARVRLLEPVRYLFKDEIRRVGQALRLPEEVCKRQPFPSSGLALRIVPSVTAAHLSEAGRADRIVREEIERAGLQKRLWQYYASICENPLDETGGIIVIVRAVQAMDRGAVAARLPSDLTERIAERVMSEVPGVLRVMYDMTPSKTYSRMEWN